MSVEPAAPFLDVLEAWYLQNEQKLRGQGIVPQFKRGAPTRKPMAGLRLQTRAGETELLLWSSGECDVATAPKGELPAENHYDLTSEAELRDLLSKLVAAAT